VLEEEPAPTRPVDRFARTTAAEFSGEPPVPGALSMRIDPDNARDSIVLVRPWLLPSREG
jgi:hypothetical protein